MDNKQLVTRFYDEVFNAHDTSHIDEFMRDDYIQHNAHVADGKAGFLEFAKFFLAMEPRAEMISMTAEGDLVCVFFKCTMMKTGAVNKVFDLYRIEGGMLAEHWDCVEHDVTDDGAANANGLF